MADVVALLGPPSTAWVDELRRCWDRGAAVLPVDHRLPEPAVSALLQALRPTMIGDRRTNDGVPAEPGDAVILATSGTTGDPKGVVLTHDAIAASARATSDRLGVDPTADTWLCCLPTSHAGGLGVVTRALLTGTPLVVHPGFDADLANQAARDHRLLVSLVATALRRVHPGLFKTIVLGGDAPPRSVPPNTVVTYGMTESGGGCVYDGVPLHGVEVTTCDGEVWIRGRLLARAYRGAAGEQPITDAQGWLHTGDGGRLEHGTTTRLHVDGRLADVIVTGGEKVWPATVESVLRTIPTVESVAVVGRPDLEWGHRVTAVVVPRDPAHPPTLADIKRAAAHTLPPWAVPKELELVDALPRTALGKIRRGAIRPGPGTPPRR